MCINRNKSYASCLQLYGKPWNKAWVRADGCKPSLPKHPQGQSKTWYQECGCQHTWHRTTAMKELVHCASTWHQKTCTSSCIVYQYTIIKYYWTALSPLLVSRVRFLEGLTHLAVFLSCWFILFAGLSTVDQHCIFPLCPAPQHCSYILTAQYLTYCSDHGQMVTLNWHFSVHDMCGYKNKPMCSHKATNWDKWGQTVSDDPKWFLLVLYCVQFIYISFCMHWHSNRFECDHWTSDYRDLHWIVLFHSWDSSSGDFLELVGNVVCLEKKDRLASWDELILFQMEVWILFSQDMWKQHSGMKHTLSKCINYQSQEQCTNMFTQSLHFVSYCYWATLTAPSFLLSIITHARLLSLAATFIFPCDCGWSHHTSSGVCGNTCFVWLVGMPPLPVEIL